ncbi:WD40 repeat domain-containing protein [Streptomyces sp. NPDC050509]|uniref:WD40 repeat domain-containing protein n=1 Tax=Streptomyces sp. NPDC050509 TaxID=3365620 RepID=UPI0037B56C3F
MSGLARTSLAFSPDSRTVAVGGPDGSLRLWDTSAPGSGGAPLPPAEGPVLALAFTGHGPAGRLHVTTPRRTLRTYDLGLPRTAEAVCARAGGGLPPTAWHTYLPDLPFRTTC